MKCRKIFCVLVLVTILPLLLVAFPTTFAHAADGIELISLRPDEGKIGDWIEVVGYRFNATGVVRVYFSSNQANKGDSIDGEVTAYQRVSIAFINIDGDFDTSCVFMVPDELVDGKDKEDVHGGDYYAYATYWDSKCISAVARFTVIDGEIEVDPEQGVVGTEVKISGEGLRNNQKITIEYDGDEVDIISGDTRTDGDGQFICAIITPESAAGNHNITVTDESGNKPEAEFSVKPKITIAPTSQVVGKTVKVNGTGFGEEECITITFDGDRVFTTPISLHTHRNGSFNGSFTIPFRPSYAGGGISKVEAYDDSLNVAEAQLTILTVPAGISLYPAISRTSPGYVGMELTVDGIGFIADSTVTITYSNSETITVATATADVSGNFSATFTVPPSVAGSHTITSTDGIISATSIFTMESEAPLIPTPLIPKVATTAGAETYFDWGDVTDPSGITYALQIGVDSDFTTIVLEKEELTDSEYTIIKEEKLESTEKETPYYWRVKAIDGAFNESEWTTPMSFYVGVSWTSMPSWTRYVWIGLGVALLTILGLWVRRKRTG